MKCNKGYELKVYQNPNAGWFIGTRDEDDDPYCRASKEYFPSKEAGEKALEDGTWTLRNSIETHACCRHMIP